MTSTTTVARVAGILAGGLLLVVAVAAPAAALTAHPNAGLAVTIPLAADGDNQDVPPVDEQPTDAQPTDAQPTGDAVVVYDPVFITPAPVATPIGEVRGVVGRPGVTPPATDTIDGRGVPTAGRSVEALLLVLGGLSALILLLGRVPGARRR